MLGVLLKLGLMLFLTLTACDVAKASNRQADKERKPV